MWVVAEDVVLLRIEFRSFDKRDGKVVSEVFPNPQVSDEVRSPSSVRWCPRVDQVSPGEVEQGQRVERSEKQADDDQCSRQSAEVERVIVQGDRSRFKSAMQRDTKRSELHQRHLVAVLLRNLLGSPQHACFVPEVDLNFAPFE